MFTLVYALAFLGFGLWVGLGLLAKKRIPKEFLFIASVGSSLVFTYALFYLYLLSPWLSRYVVYLFFAVSILMVALVIQSARKKTSVRKTILVYFVPPLLLTGIVFVGYTTLFYSCGADQTYFGGYKELRNDTFCHIEKLPFDNALPYIYGNNVVNNDDKKKALSWHLADRPPLQMGAILPILDVNQDSSKFTRFVGYHMFSVFLQLSWVGVVWGVFKKLKSKSTHIAIIIAGLAMTGLFYLHSIFVWPKLLAASLVVFAIFLFVGERKRKKLNYDYSPVAAAALALGMLSHGGVMFTVLPLAAWLAYRLFAERRHIRYMPLAISALIGLLLLVPWQLYKGSVTENDRLIKWHLGGIETPKDKRGTLETIVEEYRKLDFEEWVDGKAKNINTFVTGTTGFGNCIPDVTSCSAQKWRDLTFFSTFLSMEIFNVGWLVLAWRLFKKRLDQLDTDLVALVVASWITWLLLTFIPGSATVHAGSYATSLLVFILLAKLLLDTSPKLLVAAVIAQAAIFGAVWVTGF